MRRLLRDRKKGKQENYAGEAKQIYERQCFFSIFPVFVLMFSKCKQLRYHHKAFCYSVAVAFYYPLCKRTIFNIFPVFSVWFIDAMLTLFRLFRTLKSLANVIMSRCAMICDKFNFYAMNSVCIARIHEQILIPIFISHQLHHCECVCVLSSHFISFIIYSKIMIAKQKSYKIHVWK